MLYGQQIQTHLFQPLQVYPRIGKKGYVYTGYLNPPYPGTHIPISQAIPSYQGYPPLDLNRKFPFTATLKFLDLNRLTNDPITHSPWWSVIPTKFPSDIPKVNGNL